MTSTTETNPSLLTRLFQSESTDNILLALAGLVVRVAVGLLMIHNGVDKLGDIQGFADNVVTLIGLPFPVFFTYCAAYAEIVGSILLVLGLFTRLDAIILFGTMVVAIIFHLKADGFKIMPLETASLYAMLFLYFTASGGGTFSLDSLLVQFIGSD